MRIIGFGTYDTTRHPRAGIIFDGLREHGDDVVEVNAPLGFTTAERVAMLAKSRTAYRLLLRLLRRWGTLVRSGRRARRSGGRPAAVLVGYLGQFDVILARLLYPRDRIVLDQMIFAADTAIDRGVTSGLKLRILRVIDSVAVLCANLVIVDTEEELAVLPERRRSKAVVVPVGSRDSWFAASADAAVPVPDSTPDAPLRVVFFGLFTPLQGTPVIGDALRLLADHSDIAVTMIGTGQDWAATFERAAVNPHVTWHDWVEPDQLPAVVAGHDVCLGIFGVTPKAARVVPNKVYQGAASGCAIVTSDTAPQRRALGDAASYVPPGDADALAKALMSLAEDRARVSALRDAARQRSRAQFTAPAVVEPLRERLEEASAQ